MRAPAGSAAAAASESAWSLDVAAPASGAYLAYLAGEHSDFTSRMGRALGRTVEVAFEYRNVVNGLAVRVEPEEAALLASLPGVAAVYPDIEREVLIGFDLLLAVVVGLVLYAASARDPQAPPDFFDGLQMLLVVSALVVESLLPQISATCAEFTVGMSRSSRMRRLCSARLWLMQRSTTTSKRR